MKLRLTTFLSTVLFAAAMTGCTQDQNGAGNMGETGDTGAGQTEQGQYGETPGSTPDDTGTMTSEQDQDVTIPEESPAAGQQSEPQSGFGDDPATTDTETDTQSGFGDDTSTSTETQSGFGEETQADTTGDSEVDLPEEDAEAEQNQSTGFGN